MKRKFNSTDALENLAQAHVLIDDWRHRYNGVRPHCSINCKPPTPETFSPRSGCILPLSILPAWSESARSTNQLLASRAAMNEH